MTPTVLDVIVSELTLADFRRSIRAAVRSLWGLTTTQPGFISVMQLTLDRGFEQAWREGAKSVGILPGDRTTAEDAARQNILITSLTALPGFANFIFENQRGISPLSKSFTRAELWINRYNEVKNLAIQMSAADQKLIWQVGPTEHCVDCVRLNGKVKRASQWLAAEIKPQDSRLNCGGFRCKCTTTKTDKPLSKGPLPKLVGP